MGKLFLEKSEDLLLLDTRNIANTNVVNAANLIETLGNEQFSIFVNSHLKSSTKSMSDPVRKNKFPIFSQATTKITLNNYVTTIKKKVQLFLPIVYCLSN